METAAAPRTAMCGRWSIWLGLTAIALFWGAYFLEQVNSVELNYRQRSENLGPYLVVVLGVVPLVHIAGFISSIASLALGERPRYKAVLGMLINFGALFVAAALIYFVMLAIAAFR